MDVNTSYSDSSDVDDNPPPKKMKMRQTTLLEFDFASSLS